MDERIRADYVMPDGCPPMPRGIFDRITDEGLDRAIDAYERRSPNDPGEIEDPLTPEERASLEAVGGVGLANTMEVLFDELRKSRAASEAEL